MKVTLIFPSWFQELGAYKSAAKKALSYPLNLCVVAAISENAGWEVQLIDAQTEELDNKGIIKKIIEFSPDLIGLTATTPFFHTAKELACQIKEWIKVPILIGGTHVSILREKAFEECFDYLVVGECEAVFPRFLEAYASGDTSTSFPGMMMRRDGKIIYEGDAPFVEDLNSIPFPARHLLRKENYIIGTLRGEKVYSAVQMSRGCPFSCVFCADDLHGKRFRLRSVTSVIQELESVVRQMGVKHIFFVDDVLTLNRKFLFELCDEIKRKKLIFTFEGSTRANLWDEDLVKILVECGLVRISFGLESADLKVRDIIKKEVPLGSYIEANKICNKLKIETINSVIIGLPGDTRESIEKTISFLCKARELHHVTLNIAIPYPGTEMLRMAEKQMHGLKLLDHDYSRYQRYESAVMEVNGISPKELIQLQRKGLIRIYSCWWRIIPVIKRFGVTSVLSAGLKTIYRLAFGMFRKNSI